jgi:hypothetical protein
MWLANDRVQIALNTLLGVVFLTLIPISLLSGLKRSVPFLVFLSLWALVAAHWSGALAAWAARRSEETNTPSRTDLVELGDDQAGLDEDRKPQ